MSDKSAKPTFTTMQMLAILAKAAEDGDAATLDKHALDPASHFSQKRNLAESGEEAPQHGHTMA